MIAPRAEPRRRSSRSRSSAGRSSPDTSCPARFTSSTRSNGRRRANPTIRGRSRSPWARVRPPRLRARSRRVALTGRSLVDDARAGRTRRPDVGTRRARPDVHICVTLWRPTRHDVTEKPRPARTGPTHPPGRLDRQPRPTRGRSRIVTSWLPHPPQRHGEADARTRRPRPPDAAAAGSTGRRAVPEPAGVTGGPDRRRAPAPAEVRAGRGGGPRRGRGRRTPRSARSAALTPACQPPASVASGHP